MHESDAEIISRIHEWILKGTNQSFDALASAEKASDYSFTLLAATYREQTGLVLDDKDFLSFGLVNHNGLLTNAGCLMADQDIVYNSRLFCTRWNGLESEKRKAYVRTLYSTYPGENSFSRKEIMKEFNLTESPASDLIRKMLAVGLLEPAQERGRGQYRFVV